MITNDKKNNKVTFHKVKTYTFNNAKKCKINKSTNEIIYIKANISPTKRDNKKSEKSSALDNLW